MPELPADFDLKMMPDWLKEPAGKNPYADYEGRDDDRRARGRDDWGGRGGGRPDDRRGGRPGGGQRPGSPGGPRPGAGRRDDRGGRKPDGKGPSRPAGRPEDRRGRPGEQHREDGPRGADQRDQHAPPTQPANVTIEFFPDESCTVSIARQIKSTHRAYSLFDLARMFLARPERHRLKITTKSVAEPLYQVGEDGPVSLDRAAAERTAFPISKQKLYVEVTEQREAPKGNFSNVARCRANGFLLGPTNYHGYQPALRKLYEERFSRRMSFTDFQRDIEVVSDPALVEQWKQQLSSVTVFHLAPPATAPAQPAPVLSVPLVPAVEENPEAAIAESPEQPPASDSAADAAPEPAPEPAPAENAAPAYEGPVFASLSEVEQHFRENYLPGLIRAASSVHVSGEASRALSDRGIAAAVRQAWEQERGFPGQMMHQLRQHFSRSGLHVFKHRKRMQFVSLIRPSPIEDGSLSPSVAEILQVVQTNQNCTRASLAAAILGTDEKAVDAARKATLATDLRWLIETGRVIEFSDGRLELPVVPAKPEPPAAKAKPAEASEPKPAASTEPAPTPEAIAEVEISETEAPVAVAPEPEPPVAETVPESPAVEPIAEIAAPALPAEPEPAPAAPTDEPAA